MTIDIGSRLKELEELGLNLYSAIEVSDLPSDILNIFKDKGVPFEDGDTLVILAHGGNDMWEKLPHPLNENDHPIDKFSIDAAKKYFGEEINILYPHDSFQLPLQKIGRLTNMGRQSPIGIDINKDYGLWFAYRCLFLTKEKLPQTNDEVFLTPCEHCFDKPCLREKEFFSARLACPYKTIHQYSDEQISYLKASLKLVTSAQDK